MVYDTSNYSYPYGVYKTSNITGEPGEALSPRLSMSSSMSAYGAKITGKGTLKSWDFDVYRMEIFSRTFVFTLGISDIL